jgi:hypothetical protein
MDPFRAVICPEASSFAAGVRPLALQYKVLAGAITVR